MAEEFGTSADNRKENLWREVSVEEGKANKFELVGPEGSKLRTDLRSAWPKLLTPQSFCLFETWRPQLQHRDTAVLVRTYHTGWFRGSFRSLAEGEATQLMSSCGLAHTRMCMCHLLHHSRLGHSRLCLMRLFIGNG